MAYHARITDSQKRLREACSAVGLALYFIELSYAHFTFVLTYVHEYRSFISRERILSRSWPSMEFAIIIPSSPASLHDSSLALFAHLKPAKQSSVELDALRAESE